MKEIKDLKINLKKLVAIGASILTIGTMAGCVKQETKEEVLETPVVVQPKEEVPEEVVDPNAPSYDIQDEEVFNQKVEKLNSKIEGLESVDFYSETVILTVDDEKYAKMFLSLLNVENLTYDQLQYMNEYTPTMNSKYTDINNINSIAFQNDISLDDYIANKDMREFVNKIFKLKTSAADNGDFTEEELKFIEEFTNEIVSADALDLNMCVKTILFRSVMFNLTVENEKAIEIYNKIIEKFISSEGDLLYQMTDQTIEEQMEKTKNNTLVLQ